VTVAAFVHVMMSPAGAFALLAAVAWSPVLGFPTWPSLARGRLASTIVMSSAVAGVVYALASLSLEVRAGGRQS
jgi:hypothetical protein